MSKSFVGQLYIKLIEGKNIPAVDGKSSDPIVTFLLNDGSKAKLESKPIDKNLNPIWNEEFMFTVSSRNATVTVDVKDHNKILKNKPIGQGELQLAACPDHQIVEIWAPLQNIQGAQIHMLCRFTPMNLQANKPINVRMPSFRLQLERRVYWAGEILRGHILFNVGKPKKIRGVRVRFDGYSQCEWTESETYVDFNGDTRTRMVRYYAKITFFNPIATLYGNPRGAKEDFHIPSNTYLWPFEFALPLGLPPSFKGQYGQNYYGVNAYVDIPWAADKSVRQEFQICIQYASLKFEPTLKMSKKTKGTIFASKAPLLVAASTKDIAHIGEMQEINVSVTNQTDKDLKKLKLKLENKCTFFAERHGSWGGAGPSFWGHKLKSRRKTHSTVVNTSLELVVAPGATWTGNIQLQIPNNIPPSIPGQISPIIQCKYHLEVEAETKGNFFTKSSSDIAFQLMVGQRNPAELANIAPPTAPMGQPYQINLVKVEAITQQYWGALAPPPLTAEPPKDGVGYYGGTLPPQMYQQNTYRPEQWYEKGADEDNLMAAGGAAPGMAPAGAAAPAPGM